MRKFNPVSAIVFALILARSSPANDTAQLSKAAQKLLQQPKTGNAQIKLSDGRKENGWILSVTPQFITFKTIRKTERVELSKVVSVHWLERAHTPALLARIGEIATIGFLMPVWLISEIPTPSTNCSRPCTRLATPGSQPLRQRESATKVN